MSEIRISKLKISNYRSFRETQVFEFPNSDYRKPISIIGYNNAGKTNMVNAILYGIGEKFVNANTFEISDHHNLDINNHIEIKTRIEATPYGQNAYGPQTIAGDYSITSELENGEIKSSVQPKSFFGANKFYNIFYINFHNIKDEISIKKSSWGNLTSFLAKHIRKIVDSDDSIRAKKPDFTNTVKEATEMVLAGSILSNFIEKIRANYSNNLRNNSCEVEFGLPDYENIFLQMIFKIGLNGEQDNLVPLSHFGDGYVSMFVMAVIQAIAETNMDDKCLFLFEEPESFLHENHQEYFYKMVLCLLAEKGHQVIYTTHSDKMIDIFDTQSIIRVEFDEEQKQTVKKYNRLDEFSPALDNIISLASFNNFIKSVEPNLNKILFSRKVLLLEGPNDLLSYRFATEKIINSKIDDERYSKAYLNFKNIAFVVHHGKGTAFIIADLCNHFGLNYFIVNDWDFELDFIEELGLIESEDNLKVNNLYLHEDGIERSATRKGMITTNWKLINKAQHGRLHFNVPKLETVLGYGQDDKSSLGIWERLHEIDNFGTDLFPDALFTFLELDTIDGV